MRQVATVTELQLGLSSLLSESLIDWLYDEVSEKHADDVLYSESQDQAYLILNVESLPTVLRVFRLAGVSVTSATESIDDEGDHP